MIKSKKKVCLLASADSTHTYRWAHSLSENGLEIVICSLHLTKREYDKSIKIYYLLNLTNARHKSNFSKLTYLTAVKKLKKILKIEKPDLLHSLYLSSHGFIGALANYKPYIISVLGSDIILFPKTNILNKLIVKYSLKKCNLVLSTSNAMADVTRIYTNKEILVTPFGVDIERFNKKDKEKDDKFVIGLIKLIEPVYGIKYLIEATKIIKETTSISFRVEIYGDGSQTEYLKNLCIKYNINKDVLFGGYLEHENVPDVINNFDIAVYPSISESFGVSAIEASACGVPVIVSNVGGLPEVIEDNVTGLVVPAKDPLAIANAINKLYYSKQLRDKLGNNGRLRVEKLYNWQKNVEQMISIYEGFESDN